MGMSCQTNGGESCRATFWGAGCGGVRRDYIESRVNGRARWSNERETKTKDQETKAMEQMEQMEQTEQTEQYF